MKKIPIVLHCTENYLKNSLNLIKSLQSFHDDLIYYLYTVNFLYESNDEDIVSIYYNKTGIENSMSFVGNKNDTANLNMFKSVFLKSEIILDSLINQKLDQAIYIDSDMIPTGNISYLFQFFTELEDYPLIQKGLFEYQINYGRGNPFHNGGFDKTNILEFPLMDLSYVPIENRSHYSVSSIMIYNQKCLQFIREYDFINKLSNKLDIEKIKYYFPFSDETTINVLLWKYKFDKRLPTLQMNIDTLENVIEFYESNNDSEKEISPFIRVPDKKNRKNILFFHGVKGELSNKLSNYQSEIFDFKIDFIQNKIFILSNCDFQRVLKFVVFDQNKEVYTFESYISKNEEYWVSTNKLLIDYQKIKIKIFDEDKLIYNYENIG
jgi:hypothetical protein